MKSYKASRDTVPPILNLGARCRSVLNFTPGSLYPWEKNPHYPLNRRLNQPQGWSGNFGERKNFLPPGIKPQNVR
jgi:hypothetical protein